jgi:hypothetical protein
MRDSVLLRRLLARRRRLPREAAGDFERLPQEPGVRAENVLDPRAVREEFRDDLPDAVQSLEESELGAVSGRTADSSATDSETSCFVYRARSAGTGSGRFGAAAGVAGSRLRASS